MEIAPLTLSQGEVVLADRSFVGSNHGPAITEIDPPRLRDRRHLMIAGTRDAPGIGWEWTWDFPGGIRIGPLSSLVCRRSNGRAAEPTLRQAARCFLGRRCGLQAARFQIALP